MSPTASVSGSACAIRAKPSRSRPRAASRPRCRSDIYCEVPFRPLLAHGLGNMLGHLVLIPNPAHRPLGDFSLAAGRIGNAGSPRYTYAGVAVMSPQLVAAVTRGEKAPLAPLLRNAASDERLSGQVFTGLWQDVGTAERLAELAAQLASRT